MELGKKIKMLREENNMTQKQLAQVIQVNRVTITGYESNQKNPSYDKLIELAKFFGVSTDYLLGLVEDNISYTSMNISQDPYVKDLIDIFVNLKDNEKRLIYDFVVFILQKFEEIK